MWEEPLTTSIDTADAHHFTVRAYAGDGRKPIAEVRCSLNRTARCAAYGEMIITDRNGAPRQTERAMVLMVRAALQHAQENGAQYAMAEVPEKMIEFTQRLSGLTGAPVGKTASRLFFGDLTEMRSATLDTTDADGNFRS